MTSAFCASATSANLRQIPGFEGISQTMFANQLAADNAKIRGVCEQKLYEYDDADKCVALEAYDPNRIKKIVFPRLWTLATFDLTYPTEREDDQW